MLKPEVQRAFEKAKEIRITVTGRRSGKTITLPIWFVHESRRLLLMPVTGVKTNWYRNILKNPKILIEVDSQKAAGKAVPSIDQGKVKRVADMFRTKYGASDIKRYYPQIDACVEVPLE